MCGICGYISKKEYAISMLREMNDTMKHRGPDDSGEVIEPYGKDCYIGLGHRRLSILDLSELGHQPMYNETQDIVTVYNGEIYNFIEMRRELENRGHSFRTNCDTEVLIAAYQEYGCDFLKYLNGMFALAIYDKKQDRLLLARDRVGKKPLYYYQKEDVFIWGSELKALMRHPEFRKVIRKELISAYLCNKYINSPDTIFLNTYKVEPGQFIIIEDNQLQKGMYWNLVEVFNEKHELFTDFEKTKLFTKQLIQDAVQKRMISDVPVGAFLSGGIDSTLITAVAQEIKGSAIDTYTIGFETRAENEAVYAKQVSQYLGTRHTELYVSEKELLNMVEDLPNYFDEPFADSSQIPTMLVSRLARQNVTVALSGDGGDELFCGYKWYDWVKLAHKLDFSINFFKGIVNTNLADKLPDKLYAFLKNQDSDYKTQLFADVRQRYTTRMVRGNSVNAKFNIEKSIKTSDWQVKRMIIDMKSYLPDEIMCKTDRASMKYSLETRSPLLDYRLIELSFRMPQQFKYYHGKKKYILKEILFEYVPEEMLDRPKQGFGVPLAKWLRTSLYKELVMYADREKLEKQEIFEAAEIWHFIEMLKKSDASVYSSVLWSFYVFQKWYQVYIEDLWQ